MDDFPKAFYSAPEAYTRMWRNLILGLGAFLVVAVIIGQIKGHRFPIYRDLLFAVLAPCVLFAILAALTHVGCARYPIRLGPVGLKSSTLLGVPTQVQWGQIREATFERMQGVPYIFLKIEGRLQVVYVPIWLRSPEAFVAAVREYAGPRNPLTALLNSGPLPG